ncbi:unnamed protein product, partial [Amoebophrya sp. A25]
SLIPCDQWRPETLECIRGVYRAGACGSIWYWKEQHNRRGRITFTRKWLCTGATRHASRRSAINAHTFNRYLSSPLHDHNFVGAPQILIPANLLGEDESEPRTPTPLCDGEGHQGTASGDQRQLTRGERNTAPPSAWQLAKDGASAAKGGAAATPTTTGPSTACATACASCYTSTATRLGM